MISTYAELQTAVLNWLHRDMASSIPDLIALGEDRIYRILRVREMEQSLSQTISSGVVSVPSDYVNLKFAYLSSVSPNRWLERKPAEWIYRNDPYRSAQTGVPRYIAREVDNFIFSPYPAANYTLSGVYYKRLDPISTTLNSIFTNHPALWLFAALCESAPFIQSDKRIAVWEKKFADTVLEVSSQESLENQSGSRLAMTSELMNTNS